MFYGVIHEDYMFEISLGEGIEAVKKWLKEFVATIMKKAGELLEKAKKAKSAAADKIKEVYEKLKAIDKEIKDIKDQNGAKKVKTETDETKERLDKLEEIVKGIANRDKTADDALDRVNTAADNAVKKANDIVNNSNP
jgi:predicted  nucleic acid-binding Zn-ribbon protein